MGRKKTYAVRSQWQNSASWLMYMARAEEINYAQREWHNMGDYFDSAYIERMLYYWGQATIWYDDVVKSFCCGKLVGGCKYDIYGHLTSWRVECINGYRRELDTSNAVIVYDSPAYAYASGSGVSATMRPVEKVSTLVDRIMQCVRSQRTNIAALGTPVILSGDRSQMMDLQRYTQALDEGIPYIMLERNMMEGAVDMEAKALDLHAQDHVQTFSVEIERLWNEVMSVLGVENLATQKAERLIVDEVQSSNEQTSIVADAKIRSRNNALGKLNAIYGTKCLVTAADGSVSAYRKPYEHEGGNIKKNDDATQKKGGENNNGNDNTAI